MVNLFVVLFAVLAMHGLASDERAHGESAATAVPVVVAADGELDAHHVHATAVPDTQGNGQPSPDPDRHLDGGACLALLGLLAGLIALALRQGLRARRLPWLRGVTVELLPRGRPADPPCLHRLSIMRC